MLSNATDAILLTAGWDDLVDLTLPVLRTEPGIFKSFVDHSANLARAARFVVS